MKKLMLFGTAVGMCAGISVARGQDTTSVSTAQPKSVMAVDSVSARPRPRPHAIEYSDAYATRLTIHKYGSYIELPMFAAEWKLGQDLMDGNAGSGEKTAHQIVAGGIAGLFAINTVTGVWNLAESWKDPSGRTRRLLHSALMIGSDAGFAWAGLIAGDARNNSDVRNRHRTIALTSIGLSTVGTAMMWLWKD
jgi:hypothetical protein